MRAGTMYVALMALISLLPVEGFERAYQDSMWHRKHFGPICAEDMYINYTTPSKIVSAIGTRDGTVALLESSFASPVARETLPESGTLKWRHSLAASCRIDQKTTSTDSCISQVLFSTDGEFLVAYGCMTSSATKIRQKRLWIFNSDSGVLLNSYPIIDGIEAISLSDCQRSDERVAGTASCFSSRSAQDSSLILWERSVIFDIAQNANTTFFRRYAITSLKGLINGGNDWSSQSSTDLTSCLPMSRAHLTSIINAKGESSGITFGNSSTNSLLSRSELSVNGFYACHVDSRAANDKTSFLFCYNTSSVHHSEMFPSAGAEIMRSDFSSEKVALRIMRILNFSNTSLSILLSNGAVYAWETGSTEIVRRSFTSIDFDNESREDYYLHGSNTSSLVLVDDFTLSLSASTDHTPVVLNLARNRARLGHCTSLRTNLIESKEILCLIVSDSNDLCLQHVKYESNIGGDIVAHASTVWQRYDGLGVPFISRGGSGVPVVKIVTNSSLLSHSSVVPFLLLNSYGSLYALNLKNGSFLWRVSLIENVENLWRLTSARIIEVKRGFDSVRHFLNVSQHTGLFNIIVIFEFHLDEIDSKETRVWLGSSQTGRGIFLEACNLRKILQYTPDEAPASIPYSSVVMKLTSVVQYYSARNKIEPGDHENAEEIDKGLESTASDVIYYYMKDHSIFASSYDTMNASSASDHVVWKFCLPSEDTIVKYSVHSNEGLLHSPFSYGSEYRVASGGPRRIERHSEEKTTEFVFHKKSAASVMCILSLNPKTSILNFFVIDGTTGSVLRHSQHRDAMEPISLILVEHYALYSYVLGSRLSSVLAISEFLFPEWATPSWGSDYFNKSEQNQILRVDAKVDILSYFFDLLNWDTNHQRTTQFPVIRTTQFQLPDIIHVLGVTTTKHGITPKQILLGTRAGQVISLDSTWLQSSSDLRHKEGVEQDTPWSSVQVLTQSELVANLQGIVSSGDRLESVSHVFSVGSDLFYTKIHPIQAYDSLNQSLDFRVLLTLLMLSITCCVILRWESLRRA